MRKVVLGAALPFVLGLNTMGVVFTETFTPMTPQGQVSDGVIPDGSQSGLTLGGVFNHPELTSIEDLYVTLDISGTSGDGWIGDLFVRLDYDVGGTTYSAVLLNRPGRATGNTGGYGVNGLNLTIKDATSGATTDSHFCCDGLGFADTATGIYQPDGRNISPTSTPLAFSNASRDPNALDVFNGLNPNGSWRLFVSDLSGGNEHQVNSWGLTAVPEPHEYAMASGVALLGFAAWRRRGKAVTA